jgi:ABC-type spermidine/putrescine transport system permease subunit II
VLNGAKAVRLQIATRNKVQPVSTETLTTAARANDLRAFRRVMLVFAATTVIAGAIVAFAPLGLDDALTRQLSSMLLLAGLGDTLVLHYWDRLFGAVVDVADETFPVQR